MSSSPPAFAFVAEGKLYSQLPGESAKPVDSVFVQTILDRVETTRSRNQWKNEGMAWNFGSMRRGGMPEIPVEMRRIRFCGVTGADAREMIYAIDTDYACGLFHYDITNGYERRLIHRNQFRAADLSRHETDGSLVFTVHSPDGTSHLATMGTGGRGIKEITEGDARARQSCALPIGGHWPQPARRSHIPLAVRNPKARSGQQPDGHPAGAGQPGFAASADDR
jgi:hypothetical protein